MIAYIYTASFVVAAVGLISWFLFQKTKVGTKASLVFFGGIIAYLASLFLAPMLMPMKVMVLARDFTVLAGIGFLFSFFKYNKLIAAGAVVVLSMAFGMFYLELLQDTIPNRRLLTIENDSNAEILVEVKEGTNIGQIQNIIDNYNLTYERAFNNMSSPELTDLDDYYTVNIPDNQLVHIDKIKAELRETIAIEYLENNEIVQLDDSEGGIQKSAKKLIPNDEFIQNQWGFDLTGSGQLHAFLKENNIQPKKRALIAILDTGVDSEHEDLKANFKSINARHDTDKQAHGTHCAGIAAAVSYNNKGIASVISDNQFVQVSSIKVLNDYGRGTQQGIIKGILEAADNGADVISMSLGGASSDSRQKAYEKAFDYARKKGAIVIAAAGNAGKNAKDFVPASVKGVIAVSAVNNQLNKAVFSNTVNDVKMGIAAPGVDIFSTIPENRYASFNGTSMACPHVAGLVGLMKSLKPDLTTQDAYNILNNTGIDTDMTNMTGKFIQADKAIKALIK